MYAVQLQVHTKNDTLQMCHTDCLIQDAGPLVDLLRTVWNWMTAHPSEVVTMVIGNYERLAPAKFTQPMVDSGLMDLVYLPPSSPMELDDWPTLEAMIAANTRFVVMLDYEADKSTPWLMDQFEMMWETPFSPTDSSFPCTPHRPADQPWASRQKRLFMANHNLNIGAIVRDQSLLVPDTLHIDETNNITGPGSAGVAVQNCIAAWGRPPNFILADFVTKGSIPYSVMQVAAQANNVTYRGPQLNVAPGVFDRSVMTGSLTCAMLVLLWTL